MKLLFAFLPFLVYLYVTGSYLSPSTLKGSAKLEKAEILQMTVDHLKMLHAAGGKGSSGIHYLLQKNTFHLLHDRSHMFKRVNTVDSLKKRDIFICK